MTRIVFYDSLEVNDSAVKIVGDDAHSAIARELGRVPSAETSPSTGR